MNDAHHFSTPVFLALTRRATLCGLPYNTFIGLLIGGCVAMIWMDSLSLTAILLLTSYLFCSFLSSRDMWALDIFFLRLSQIGICPWAVKHYFTKRSFAAE